MVLLLSCVSLVLADYQGAYESKRVRTGRQQREDGPPSRPQRRLRPLQKRPPGKVFIKIRAKADHIIDTYITVGSSNMRY